MRRVASVAALSFLISACAPTLQERVSMYNEFGLQHYQKGEYARASDDFQVALALLPNNPALLYNLGECYDRLGQRDRAESLYRACLQHQPNDANCRHALSVLLVENGRFVEAKQMTQDWLAREPKLSAAYFEDGWLYEREGNPVAAVERYQQAVYYDPHNIQALVEMGRVYEEELNRPSRSLKLYQTALDYNPYQPDLVRRINRLRVRGVGPPHPDS